MAAALNDGDELLAYGGQGKVCESSPTMGLPLPFLGFYGQIGWGKLHAEIEFHSG